MKMTFLFSWKMESIYGIYIWNLWQTREDGKKNREWVCGSATGSSVGIISFHLDYEPSTSWWPERPYKSKDLENNNKNNFLWSQLASGEARFHIWSVWLYSFFTHKPYRGNVRSCANQYGGYQTHVAIEPWNCGQSKLSWAVRVKYTADFKYLI